MFDRSADLANLSNLSRPAYAAFMIKTHANLNSNANSIISASGRMASLLSHATVEPHFWFHSFTFGLNHSCLPPILISQARRASSIGGTTQPHAARVLLCSHPISLRKLPTSVSVTYLALGLWWIASS